MSRVIRVSEGLGDHLDIDTGSELESGCDVAKIVEPDWRKASSLR